MKDSVSKPGRYSFLYAFVVFIASLLFRTFMPVKFHHKERARMDAPFILIANHISMIDPVIVGYGCRRHQIRFLGKDDLTKNPILRFLFRSVHMISVRRYNTDMKALRACLKVLRDDNVLGVFPEGTRYKEGVMEDMEGGVAMIALQSGAPILPAYIQDKPGWFKPTHCYFGEVFTVSDIKAKGINKDTAEEVMELIRGIYRDFVRECAQTQRK
ncbi:MAG: 1-acyl-sn-glycerol-3-phosphate acyltransferase [Clostridiales bacterium]|nr:1-acyl-sn-glycerol-3-phosphate acyltransferase [Clostridiales bacterium]